MPFPLDHIVIYAADAAASGRFYATLLPQLGFEKRRDHVFARNGLFFDIRPAKQEGPGNERGRPGVDHIGFRADNPDQLDVIQTTLEEAGVEAGRILRFDNGDTALFIPDPDGVRIEITCYANPSAESVD